MKFTKMHGCGNDYVYIDGSKEKIPDDKKAELAVRLSDRHFGIGSDGIIFINPSDEADFEMEMYNADGSRAEMCGNGIRCVGAFVYNNGLTEKKELCIISYGKKKYLQLKTDENNVVSSVRVNMGVPELNVSEIPVISQNDRVIDSPIIIAEREFKQTCVSMGNPHSVVYVDDVKNFPVDKYGPLFENNKMFPNRINTEFVEIKSRDYVSMRVWERGTGETFACGTGTCATITASVLLGLTEKKITVELLGGKLELEWEGEGNPVYMTGPAEIVFEGDINIW